MKRIFIVTLTAVLFGLPAFSQSETDILNLSRNELSGTARSVAMGGAFGALGGDISGVAINPAGIGVYKSSEFVATFNFRNNQTKAELNAGSTDKSKFNLSFDNFGIIGAFPVNNEVVPLINFGFTYNKLKNFERKYNLAGKNLDWSLADFMAERATYSRNSVGGDWSDPYVDWMGKIAYEGYIIDDNGQGGYGSILNPGEKVNSNLSVQEKGEVNSYDFNAGTTIADIVSFGLTLSLTDIDYRMESGYFENFLDGNNEGFDLYNNTKTEGTGYQIKAGVIVKPINELRLGIAYHSPTWYNVTSYHWGSLYSTEKQTIDTQNNNVSLLDRGWVDTPNDYRYDREEYDFKTPDKWAFSIAGIIGKRAIISLDYELTNYKNSMSFRDVQDGSYFDSQNKYIKQDLRNASTIRAGAEFRFTPQFSGRIGYSWAQNPYNDNLKTGQAIEPSYRSTVPHYIVEGDTHYITYGLGYKFNANFYADIAFVMKTQKDELYTFPNYYVNKNLQAGNYKSELKNNVFNGLITLGYRF